MRKKMLRTVLAATLILMLLFTLTLSGCGNKDGGATTGGDMSSVLEEGKQIAADAVAQTEKAQSEIDPAATSSKKDLIFASVADPGRISLDNLFDMTQYPFATACVEYFIRYDFTKKEFYSPVCDSYEVDADNLGVTFHIKPGIKMHDGEEFTAEDLVASIQA